MNSKIISDKNLIIIGFAEALSSPEVAWSLVDAGYRVAAFARKGRKSALRQSRHVTVFEITPPEEDSLAAQEDLSDALARCQPSDVLKPAVLFPLDDASVWLCNQLTLAPGWIMAGPRNAAVRMALDKSIQIILAGEVGFSVPKTTVATATAQVLNRADSWPMILKPVDAVLPGSSRLRKGSNWICANRAELDLALFQWQEKYPLLVQPFITGTGEGVFGLATKDGVRCLSAHRRLRMMNPHGSGSSACASQPVPEILKESIERMIKESGWIGLFMIELLRDQSGRYWFVEFNGRAWGSMALARRQGFEYPAWAVQLALQQEIQTRNCPSTEEEVTCRNLGREFMHLLFVLRGRKSTALQEWPSFWRSVADVLFIRPRDSIYNFRRDDLAVLVSDCFCTVRDQAFKQKKEIVIKAACHIHSDWSYDGKWPLSKLASAFGKRGYRAILMTEHDRGFSADRLRQYREACAEASSDAVLVVPGIEYSDATNTVHVLVWGPVPFLGENLPTAELLVKVRAAHGVAVLAHPSRRNAWKCFDPSWTAYLAGIELWNRKTDGWAPSKDAAQLLCEHQLPLCVGMDFHTQKQFFPMATRMDLANGVTEDSILTCLRNGRHHATAFNLQLNRNRPGGLSLAGLNAVERCRRGLASAYRRFTAPKPFSTPSHGL